MVSILSKGNRVAFILNHHNFKRWRTIFIWQKRREQFICLYIVYFPHYHLLDHFLRYREHLCRSKTHIKMIVLYFRKDVSHFINGRYIHSLIIWKERSITGGPHLTFFTEHGRQDIHHCFLLLRIFLHFIAYCHLEHRIGQDPIVVLSLTIVRKHCSIYAVCFIYIVCIMGCGSNNGDSTLFKLL